jgi:hypothetical protein
MSDAAAVHADTLAAAEEDHTTAMGDAAAAASIAAATKVWRCRLAVIRHVLKARMVSALEDGM